MKRKKTNVGSFAAAKLQAKKSRRLFLAALLALMAVGAFAQQFTEGDWVGQISNNQVEIYDYKGSAKTVNIPEKIRNLPVTVIGSSCFEAKNITSVTIPITLISI